MGNEIKDDERESRNKELHNALHIIDKDIMKDLFNSDVSKKQYMSFGLVNKDLCKKYKFLGNEVFDRNEARNKIFDYKDLIKKKEYRKFNHIHPDFDFTFPSNFMFINKDFLDVIMNFVVEKYRHHLKTICNTIIGGGCLIMRDAKDKKDENPYRYIILYHDINDNIGNEIDFFLYIKDKKERQAADIFILQNDLWAYFKKIKYSYKEEYRKIHNDNNQEIGYVVRCSDIFRIETYIAKCESLKQTNPKDIKNILPAKDNSNISFDSSILFLFQIEELKKFICQNKNLDLEIFKKSILDKTGQNSSQLNTYDKIFDKLLTKLDSNREINNDNCIQSEQYDEEKGLKKFMEKLKNKNIIQKLFFIPKEEKICCKKCGMNIFQFYYSKYILIQNPLNELLSKKIFMPEIENKLDKFCNFCNGQITNLTIEKKILDFPEILIVIISLSEVNNFQIRNNLFFTNGIVSYSLNKFIESTNNCLYCIDDKNNMICHKYKETGYRFEEEEKIENKRPIVLFYKLINNPINQNNISDNIKTIDVLNQIKNYPKPKTEINMNKNQQNLNQMNIQQQNINFQFQNNEINQQNMIPQITNQFNQMNINNQQQNFNLSNFNQSPQIMNSQNLHNSVNYFQNNFNNNCLNNNFNNSMNQFNNMNNNIQMNNINNSNMNNNCINNNFMMNNNNGNIMNIPFQNNMMNNNIMNNMNIMNNVNNMNMMNNNNMNFINNNFQNMNQNFVDFFNQIIVIQFISADFRVNKGIKCLPSQKFHEVEEQLYNFYPEYRKTNNNFITNGGIVLKFQTIAENKIKDGQVIQIEPIE